MPSMSLAGGLYTRFSPERCSLSVQLSRQSCDICVKSCHHTPHIDLCRSFRHFDRLCSRFVQSIYVISRDLPPRQVPTIWVNLQSTLLDHPTPSALLIDLECETHFFASPSLVPCNLTTSGILISSSLVALMIPSAITSHLMIPPTTLSALVQ